MDVYMDQDLPLSPTLSFYVNETEWWTTVSLNPIVPPTDQLRDPSIPAYATGSLTSCGMEVRG